MIIYLKMDQLDLCAKCGNNHQGACSTEAIYFYWYPDLYQYPHQVFIVGDWSKWQRKEPMTRGELQNGDIYFYILLALSSGRHEYKFQVDSLWRCDNNSPTVRDCQGNINNIVEILPKKSYVEKHLGSDVKITSNIPLDGLKIIGSWNEWSQEHSMTKTFNPLKACDENIIYLNLEANRTYEFKFKYGNQYMVDEKYPTIPNQFGTLNNYIVVYHQRISIETPNRPKKSSAITMSISPNGNTPRGRSFKWRKVVNSVELPYQRVEGHSMCAVGEYLYIFGGKSRNEFYNSLLKINSRFDKVQFEEIVPDGRAFHCMKAYGNKILIYGGHNNRVLQDYHAFNVSDGKWQTSPNLQKPHSRKIQKQSCVIYDSLFVFFGGYYCNEGTQCESLCGDIEVLDLEKMQWIESVMIQGEHPEGRYGHTASLLESTMYIFGGIVSLIDFHNLNDLWKINLENVSCLSWQKVNPKGSPPTPRRGHTMNSLLGLLVIFGGQDDSNHYLNDLVVYNAANNQWIHPFVQGFIPRGRSNHASANFINDQIVIFGGKTQDNSKNSGFYILEAADVAKSTSFFVEGNSDSD